MSPRIPILKHLRPKTLTFEFDFKSNSNSDFDFVVSTLFHQNVFHPTNKQDSGHHQNYSQNFLSEKNHYRSTIPFIKKPLI